MTPYLMALAFTGALVAVHAAYSLSRRFKPPRNGRPIRLRWWAWLVEQLRPERPLPSNWKVWPR